MNGSPITSWEGAEAYFTFADRPGIMMLILGLAFVATFAAIFHGGKHEAEAYKAHIPE